MTTTITKGPIGEQDLYRWDGVTGTFTRATSTGATETLNKIGGEVDALMVYGGGTNYTSTTIQSALTSIGTSNQVSLVLRPGTWAISASLSFPSNVVLNIMPGATLVQGGAFTLTFATPPTFTSSASFSGFTAGQLTGLYGAILSKTTTFTIDLTYAFSTVHIKPASATVVNVPAASAAYSGVWIDLVPTGATGTVTSDTITLTLASGYWWNNILVNQSVTMAQKCRIWCDGTYWYASPIEIGIPPATVLTNGVSGGSWTAVDISTPVPTCARGVVGKAAILQAGYYIFVAPVWTGYGKFCELRAAGTYGTTGSFRGPLIVPQTIYYYTDEPSAYANSITITGFYM